MKNQRWYRLYEAVLLQLEAPRLNERMDAIDVAIRERFAELEPSSEHDKERQMLAEAKVELEILRRNELKPLR
jgi:hypothetical protein